MAEINLHCNSENLQVIKCELESVIDENVTYITGPVLYTPSEKNLIIYLPPGIWNKYTELHV